MLLATPALATGDIVCGGENVSVEMNVGRLPILGILRAVITIGDKTWSSEPDRVPGTPILVGHQFEDDQKLLVDFTDDNVEEIVARLRAFSLGEGDGWMSAGVFSMKGEGVFAVDCSLRG